MWSGPRNISTALMRSWGNRPDTIVCDEPLYAFYLQQTGRIHPGRDETLATQQSDWRKVREELLAELPAGKTVFYQKHMAHHLLASVERDVHSRPLEAQHAAEHFADRAREPQVTLGNVYV